MENIRRKILSLENILGLFVLVMLCSCADQERQSKGVLKFDERIQLNGEQVFEKEFNHIVEVAGDYILLELNSRDTSNNVYNVYDARTLEFLGSIGKRGQGPGEFYGAQYAGQYYVKGGDTFIWVNDAPQYRITSINVTQSLEMGKTVVDRIIKHHPKYNFQNALYVSDEGDLIGYQPGFIPNSNKYPLHILKGGAGESLNEVNVGWFDIGEYPKMESLDLIPEGERFSKSFNRARIAMKPDQSRFVVGMSYYDRLDIFKKNGDLVKSARDPERYRQYNAVEVYAPEARIKLKNRYDYYQKLVATDDYIYALYWNRNMRELNAEMGEAVEIRVFDWEGNLKYLLKCPDNLILITVDEKNKYLYGYVEDDQKFMRYSIEVILE